MAKVMHSTFTDIVNAYIWLLHYLITSIKDDISDMVKRGTNKRQARLEAQSEKYKMLTYAYGELAILNCFRESMQTAPECIRDVLHRLSTVYAYSTIDKHIAMLYIGTLHNFF